jgi:Holliday junction resolvase
LLGKGGVEFEWKNFTDTGFFIREEIRHLETFSDKKGGRYIIAAINSHEPRVYRYNK